jgi:hypothetical protein
MIKSIKTSINYDSKTASIKSISIATSWNFNQAQTAALNWLTWLLASLVTGNSVIPISALGAVHLISANGTASCRFGSLWTRVAREEYRSGRYLGWTLASQGLTKDNFELSSSQRLSNTSMLTVSIAHRLIPVFSSSALLLRHQGSQRIKIKSKFDWFDLNSLICFWFEINLNNLLWIE